LRRRGCRRERGRLARRRGCAVARARSADGGGGAQALADSGGVPALVHLLGAGGELAAAAAGVLRELCALKCGRVRARGRPGACPASALPACPSGRRLEQRWQASEA
jgi:hypothetical protein